MAISKLLRHGFDMALLEEADLCAISPGETSILAVSGPSIEGGLEPFARLFA